jgi:hypothetical protein
VSFGYMSTYEDAKVDFAIPKVMLEFLTTLSHGSAFSFIFILSCAYIF